MNDAAQQSERQGMLLKPTYGYVGPAPRTPTTREVLLEWLDAINFWKDRTRLIPALYVAWHFATFAVFVYYLVSHFSITAVVSVIAIGTFIGTVYNTVWYHRYCSHQAFKFRSIWFARLFLWTNPISFREESYVVPHRIHHWKSDEPGDPYGPHLGWLGSYLATETQQKMNRDITPAEFERMARGLEHIGLVQNSYEQYKSTGSVENLWHYLARVLVVNLLWPALAYVVAGWEGVMAWVSGVFLFTFIVRDFNYRGHSSLVGNDKKGEPVNQFIYGLIAGEWHENHHKYPRLARSGLVWWQIDIPYWTIKAMKACGMVTHYNTLEPVGGQNAGQVAQPT